MVQFQAAVLPICVPWNVTGSQGEPSAKGDLFVAAWERREKDTGFFHAVNSGKVNYMASQSCKKIPAFNLISTDRHVCAGELDGKVISGFNYFVWNVGFSYCA